MKKIPLKMRLLTRRRKRIRKKINGTTARPRLSVFRSARHVYAQVIDDVQQRTLVSISSFGKGERTKADVAGCKELGKKLASKCLQQKIATMVFDRNGYVYHGRVKALADGVREGGVSF
ncbi:MAG: 50S ribosomal protein L18 [Pseudomonadota bacterium]|nr:50S ribosomal protein L18 [Pseudomonadota bacterium]